MLPNETPKPTAVRLSTENTELHSGTTSNASSETEKCQTRSLRWSSAAPRDRGETTRALCMVNYLTHFTPHALQKGPACRNSGWGTLWGLTSHSHVLQKSPAWRAARSSGCRSNKTRCISGPVLLLDHSYNIHVALVPTATLRAPTMIFSF